MLKLWGRPNSVNVQKAAFALEEAGAPYERIDAGMAFGVVGTDEYLAKNPNNLIPVLEDGDFILWESNVIVRYVAARFSPDALYPDDLKQRADSDRWMDWQQTTLMPALGPAFLGLIRTPPDKRDMAAIDASIARTDALLAILDRHFASRAYLTGGAFTMGDVAIGAAVHRWYNLPLKRSDYPALRAYYDRVYARPAAKKTLILPVT